MYILTLYTNEIVIVTSMIDRYISPDGSSELAQKVEICRMRLFNALGYLRKLGYHKKGAGEYVMYQRVLDAIHSLDQPSKEKALRDCNDILSRRIIVDNNGNFSYEKRYEDN